MNGIKVFLLTTFVAAFGFASHAQEKIDPGNYSIEATNDPSQEKKYHAKIFLTNGQKLKGIITSIGDSSIQLEKVVYNNVQGVHPAADKSLQYNEVYYSDIQTIKIRGTVGGIILGFFSGTVVGAVAGGLIGLARPCEDCAFIDRLAPAVLLAGVGGAIGGPANAVAQSQENHKIAGEYSSYQKFIKLMEEKRIGKMKKKKRS